MTFHPQPKPRPVALDRADRRKALKAADEAENKKVRERSGGLCEITFVVPEEHVTHGRITFSPCCQHRAVHVHHCLSGIGVRGRGASANAENKLHVCAECHRDIHARLLVPDGPHFRLVR